MSAACLNLDFKNLTLLWCENAVLPTTDMCLKYLLFNPSSKRIKYYGQQTKNYIFSITEIFSLNSLFLFMVTFASFSTKQYPNLFAMPLFLKYFFCVGIFLIATFVVWSGYIANKSAIFWKNTLNYFWKGCLTWQSEDHLFSRTYQLAICILMFCFP